MKITIFTALRQHRANKASSAKAREQLREIWATSQMWRDASRTMSDKVFIAHVSAEIQTRFLQSGSVRMDAYEALSNEIGRLAHLKQRERV